MSDKSILKLLCIHGYRQTGQAFRERTGAFRKLVKKHAEMVFIDAPNRVPPLPAVEAAEPVFIDAPNRVPPLPAVEAAEPGLEQRGWWFSRQDDYFNARDASEVCKGYEESLTVIRQAFKEQGPFDGVLGFSQGAAMVALMCALQQADPQGCGFAFRFAVLVAGFKSGSSPHLPLYDAPVTLPTLHVYGKTDKVIPKDMSEDLLQHFVSPQTLEHEGGHFIPASSAQKKIYVEFLDQQLKQNQGP